MVNLRKKEILRFILQQTAHVTTKSYVTSYHTHAPPATLFKLYSWLHDKAKSGSGQFLQVAIDELPHRFLQARREYVGRARSSPKLSLPDAITILRDKKKALGKNGHGQTSAQTHCDANNRNDCPSLAICDWFEFGTNLGNITHGY